MTSDPSKLSVKYLLESMTIGQALAFSAAMLGLLGGSYGIGYEISESLQVKSERDLSSIEFEVEGLAEKNRFLALYLRFMVAKHQLDATGNYEDDYELYETTRDALNGFVRERVDSESLILHKGGRLATIWFKDGTVWELPPDIHIVEAS